METNFVGMGVFCGFNLMLFQIYEYIHSKLKIAKEGFGRYRRGNKSKTNVKDMQ